jgi:hypothetical protein
MRQIKCRFFAQMTIKTAFSMVNLGFRPLPTAALFKDGIIHILAFAYANASKKLLSNG